MYMTIIVKESNERLDKYLANNTDYSRVFIYTIQGNVQTCYIVN